MMKLSTCTIDSIWTAKQQKKLQQEQELKVTPNIAWKADKEAQRHGHHLEIFNLLPLKVVVNQDQHKL